MITIDHLVHRITVHILPTRTHLWSANFSLHFTRWLLWLCRYFSKYFV